MKKTAVLQKFGLSIPSLKKNKHLHNENDSENQAKWLHHGKEIKDSFIAFNAKYLGSVEVSQPKGVEMVKDSIKKLKIARQLKKAEAGHKGSKLIKVEIIISIDSIKVVELKNKNMICSRPLQRVSYCADDHRDKRLFAFIAKEQESKCHKCFVFVSEKEASEITLTLGQAFQLAYKRYLEKEKAEIKQNKESITIDKEITKLKEENEKLKLELDANKHKTQTSANLQGDTSSSIGNNSSALYSEPTSPMQSSLPTASFGGINDSPTNTRNGMTSSFDASFEQLSGGDSSFPTHLVHDTNTNDIDIFGSFDGSAPRDEDFYVKSDPFADTPDWSSVASEESMKQPAAYQNGNTSAMHEHNNSVNPFAASLILDDSANNSVNNNNINNNSNHINGHVENNMPVHENNADVFSQYLSNVVAQRSYSDAGHLNGHVKNSTRRDLFEINGHNGSMSSNEHSINGINEDFSANNEFGFNKLNLTGDNMNINNEDNESDYGFFPDFVQRPKSHTITCLSSHDFPTNFSTSFTSSRENVNESNLTASGNAINEVDETNGDEDFFASENSGPLQKTQSCGAQYMNQMIRPRPNSFSVHSQGLPAPPTKQAIKSCIKSTPSPTSGSAKPLASTPMREDTTPRKTDHSAIVPERRERVMTTGSFLPNVRNSAPAPVVDTRPRSRSRASQLQPAAPLKESISRASKSLEDLCSIDSTSSNRSSSPRSRTSSAHVRNSTNPFHVQSTPISQF